jgi:ADP-heptose:LPS heptosyltransferase
VITGQNTLQPRRNILVIRNDKLGDFMLAWPAFALLKKQYPDCKVTALVPEYTRPIAELCPWIDKVLIDKKGTSTITSATQLAAKLREQQFDISISLFSEFRVALALWMAHIPVRIAPATKLAQIFYTHRLKQRRSRSEKPEFEYNLDLIKYYITLNHDQPVTPQVPPFLSFDKTVISQIRNDYCKKYNIDENAKLVIIHPGSGGSAINLSLQQYAELARLISRQLNIHIIVTAGPNELAFASNLSSLLGDTPHSVYHSTSGLVEFSRFIAVGNIFISGSTGTLHIAGALNVPTAAFYPARRSATPLRWQTLNSGDNRIAFMPATHKDNNDMKSVNLEFCAQQIVTILKLNHS